MIYAETAISDTPIRRRPFDRSICAFPTPINETLNSFERPKVILSPWFGENDNKEDKLEQDEDCLFPVGEMCEMDCQVKHVMQPNFITDYSEL